MVKVIGYLDQWRSPEPPSTREEFAERATEILRAIVESQAPHDDAAYIGHWSRLFELLRKLRASDVKFREHDRGPWAKMGPDTDGDDMQLWLVGGKHRSPIRMPKQLLSGDAQLATDLEKILNGAGVQPPSP